ncbi:3-deoxy-manno-octulosonate cytidylyltransferase (CMP-KDO synthetase) [Litoreibacter ascidiaceicola]|uniref:3-deoxy-manno-octulosonate cytidylyltransferase (CMP-KDO synthetase) n=1 Tax=Litoreibacter ascidiaceicola TaxID=1486859 RepID=A0A1M5BS35_9RHOB|nr:3-deoxy-manno-octulosonate cytidylyltransferase [Litoreibacter ascidiaceicola]SHF45171.1 3-deoxy-manno-octulosonate cytidylyltransferase (CMP-KDO synthetase) [Litoreibacter ascidiaceicola]
MSVTIVIPARYASTRYPGKPLVTLTGATGEARSLIERSWNAAKSVSGVDRVVVATDDERIKHASEAFGAETVMTSSDCFNGTERCADALPALGTEPEIVVNLQGDAPLTPAWFVEDLIKGLRAAPDAACATPVLRCDGWALNGFLEDRRNGRVGGTTAVFAQDMTALYFSKEVIPFTSNTYSNNAETPVFHHVGVYAYRPDALRAYAAWPVGPLEKLEGLEQLRFLENGRKILCVEVEARGRQFWELNNPEDVPRLEAMLSEMGHP